MVDGTGLRSFANSHPDRCFDVGIAEGHAVGMASGLALGGRKPVVALYSTFFQRAIDQAIINVSLEKLNVVFALDRAGLVGDDGPTHHGMFDMAFLRWRAKYENLGTFKRSRACPCIAYCSEA